MENKRNFRYLTIEEFKNGLQISLNEEGIELVKELKEDGKSEFDIWYELFEDVRGNSEYIFHDDMGESGFGMTSAEGITDGYFNSDSGDGYETDYPESAKIYWFPNYMIISSLDKMYEEGKVFFTKADEKYKNGGGIYSSDDRWVVTFQNQDSAKFEKVTVRANNKKNAIAIAEDESGLGSDWQYYSAEKEMANGGSIDEETIIRNKNKNDWKSKFDFYLKYNNGNIGKGSLMDMAYDDTKGVDSAIPQSLVGDVDNTAFFVYDYKDNFAGELVDLRDKLKFSNTKVDVTVVVNGDVLRKDNLPNELLNPTFHQALDYVFKHDEVEAFSIRPTKSRYENGGDIKSGNTLFLEADSKGNVKQYSFIEDDFGLSYWSKNSNGKIVISATSGDANFYRENGFIKEFNSIEDAKELVKSLNDKGKLGSNFKIKHKNGGGVSDNKFNYMMLSRLQSDNDYFLGYGNRSERNLWADNVDSHIAEMKRLWNILPEDGKPEWLSMEDILKYEKEMKKTYPEVGDKVIITTASLGEKYKGMSGTINERKLLNDKYSIKLENGMDMAFSKDEFRHNSINPRYENGGGVAKELKGYRVNIYKSDDYTSPQNIVSNKFKNIVLVTDGIKGDSFSVMSNEPYIKLVKRNLFGKEFLSAEPVNFGVDKNHKMFGGSFVWSSDSRFRENISERPIPLHDRVEVYENGGVFVPPHVNDLHNYIIASYGFLLPQEGESGYDKFTYSDFAEELKSTYDIKNPRNKQVYDYLIHLGNVKMFSGNVSDMKKIQERMSTANVKFENGGGVNDKITSKAKHEIDFLTKKGYDIDAYSTLNRDAIFGGEKTEDFIIATQGSIGKGKDAKFAIAYWYRDDEDGELQISRGLLNEISDLFKGSTVVLYTNAGVDLHSITEGKHKNIQVVKVAYGEFSGNSDEYAKGGTVESLEKELRKLQRDLNSHRLSTYMEGDESEERKALNKEREVKLARFNEVLDLLRDNESKLANGGTINKKKLKGDIGKITGKQYGYTLENFEKAQESIFVSPNDYWKKQQGSDYKDFIGRKQLITDRDKDRLMESYAYKIMIAIDLGSKKVPLSAKKYAESIYELNPNEIAAKYSKGGGINSGRDLLFKSKEPHEQAYKRKREFKKYGDNGNWFNDFFENGGDIANQNALMVMNDNKQIKHHTEELNKVVDTNTTVPAWIVAKVHRSASDLSDATHYLDGVNTEFKNGGNVSYGDIKKEKEKMTSELFEKCGVFFAFSNEQFLKNKTPLKEGEKYVSIGGGGYMPKGNYDAFTEGMKSITKIGKKKVEENNLAETEILYELNNHECFYTGDYSDVVDMFKGTYTEEQIRDVYNKHRESNQTFKNGGGVTDVTKNILKEYIFEYKYPKHKNKPSVNQYYSVDTSKVIPIGGMSEDGFKLKFINGNESGTVITVIKALQAIRNGEIEFEQSEGYFVKIKAIKKDSFANGGGISSDIIFVSAKNKEDRDNFFESITNLMPDHFIIKQGDLSVQLEVNPSDMSSIKQMAKTYNVEVITDNKVEPSAYYGDLISINLAEKALGRKINSWKDEVITIDGISYRKVFLKPEYKKIK
jgi:hypothetical protein